MWCLEGYDRTTELLVQEVPLPRLNSDDIHQILGIDDVPPVGMVALDIPTYSELNKLAAYADGTAEINPGLDYFLGSTDR
jgi:hypothetical protein